MLRRGISFIVIVSTLLCLAAVGGWIRSQYRYDVVDYTQRRLNIAFISQIDCLELHIRRHSIGMFEAPFGFDYYNSEASARMPLPDVEWRLPGIAFSHTPPQFGDFIFSGQMYTSLSLTWWLLVLLTAIPPFLWLLKRRRHPAGCCPSCGYDLRATPNRCPECGAAPTEVAT